MARSPARVRDLDPARVQDLDPARVVRHPAASGRAVGGPVGAARE
jgi:hypothetical protein